MSPEPKRQDSRRASASNSKPYSRQTTPDNLLQPPSQEIAQPGSIPVPDVQSQPGFPTYVHYKRVEANYINSLTPRRQEKTLITQAMFDRIWDVLNEPDTDGEKSQFRFWVRKMFSLGRIQHSIFGQEIASDSPRVVLLHDKLPVAIQEQLYDLLCYCHGNTNHGGRDKTHDLVRKHYSWVPKALIAQFVKICPTCILKKSGNPDLMALAMHEDSENIAKKGESKYVVAPSLPALNDLLCGLTPQDAIDQANCKENWPVDGPLDETVPLFDTLSTSSMSTTGSNTTLEALLFSPTRMNNTRPSPPSLSSFASSSRNSRGLQSLPMSREVSLYKGLPNGWQYHSDYATAHADFMKNKDFLFDAATQEQRIREKRPRIPSIVPLRDANFKFIHHTAAEETRLRRDTLPPLMDDRAPRFDRSDSLPASLQVLRVVVPTKEYIPQIDPALLAESCGAPASNPARCNSFNSSSLPVEFNAANNTSPIPAKFQTSTSTLRAAAPPPLNLSSLNTMTSHESLQQEMNFRDRGSLTPDSPLSPWAVATPSPSSSADSCSSRLFSFPVTVTTSSSPATTAFPTPSDEALDMLGKELADTTDGLHLSTSAQAVCGMNVDDEK